MKKRDLFIILLVGVISLIIPKGVFAADLNLQYTPFIDYRFFLEDENENNIENLQFRLHDVNNLISYDSKYDQETKVYYFIDLPSNTFFDKTIETSILPEYLITEIESINYLGKDEWDSLVSNLSQKHDGVDIVLDNSGPACISIYLPMILEEVNHTGAGEPIKKVVFAAATLLPQFNASSTTINLAMGLSLINNTCMYDYDTLPPEIIEELERTINRISLTRNQTFDYSEEIIQMYTTGDIASNEIKGNEYLNKGFNSNQFPRITSGEFASGEGVSSKNKGTNYRVVQLRTSNDNIPENILKDYCDCLPVFVQTRKTTNIIDVLTNPQTFNTGILALIISLLVTITVIGVTLTKRKNEV